MWEINAKWSCNWQSVRRGVPCEPCEPIPVIVVINETGSLYISTDGKIKSYIHITVGHRWLCYFPQLSIDPDSSNSSFFRMVYFILQQ
jgi:hypothetical protein